ncbi:hypothetical protein [Haloglycomyces albus]|uniref:hypothetical protein n=1 Tax=Haloglycomyces albus TaxID=526067 RepID=UPI00046CCBFB|nr:hypothetical protein [Haloglycomyces albus]
MTNVQDIDAIDDAKKRLQDLAKDSEKLKEAAANADPGPTTWGVILGLIIGIAYETTVGEDVEATLEDLPLALEGNAMRLEACARNYESTDESIAAALTAINGELSVHTSGPC